MTKPSSNAQDTIIRELGLVFEPLASVDSVYRVTALFAELGYELPGGNDFPAFPELAARVGATIQALLEFDDANSDSEKGAAILDLATQIVQLTIEIIAMEQAVHSAVAAFPAFVNNAPLDELPIRLLDYVIIEYTRRRRPAIHAAMTVVGVFETDDLAADAAIFQPATTLRKIFWERLPKLVSDPAGLFDEVYAWETAFNADKFFTNVSQALRVFMLPGGLYTQSPTLAAALGNTTPDLKEVRFPLLQNAIFPSVSAEFGVDLTSVEAQGGKKAGLALVPYTFGSANFDFDVSDKFQIEFKTAASMEGGLGIVGRPEGVEFLTDLFQSPGAATTFDSTLTYKQKEGTGELILFGKAGGTRFSVEGINVKFFASNQKGGKDAGAEFKIDAIRLVIAGGEGDTFLNLLLGDAGVQAEAEIVVGLSARQGFYFEGSGGLELRIPTHISLGPVEIQGIILALEIQDGNFVIEAGVILKGSFGPMTAIVENIGLTTTISFPDHGGNMGPADLTLGFKWPNGVGLSIDAGVVKGGGYLYLDFDKGEYAGALELSVANTLSLKAIGLINTKPGFSLLIIITAEFSPGFQLGYGFTLIGVGGLLGLNRTMLLEPMVQGVRTGAVNSILFPTDVVANAPKILNDLRTIFPPYEGIFLIGPMAKIGWGTPTLISVSLGVIIEIPGNIAILGRIKIALPTEELAVLVLQVTFIGALEFTKSRGWFFASLYESRILFITIDGDMGLLMDFSSHPNFLVSVGGIHPSYKPPPLPFPTPTRVSLNIVDLEFARVRAEGYFAVTTNSVQMGGRLEAFFGFDAFSVEGHFGIDVLLRFSPVYFIAEMSAGFSVKLFGMGVWGVHVKGKLEGPTPWHVNGTAGIEFLFFTFDVDVEVTFGQRRSDVLPTITLMGKIVEEFSKLESWRATLPSSGHQFVSLRDLNAATDLVLHPVGSLLISQRFAPLNLPLDKIGNQKLADVRKISVAPQTSALKVKGTTREQFAAAQYQEMDDAKKLSRPAFESMDGGLELAPDGNPWKTAAAAQRNVTYELIIIDTEYKRHARKFFKFWNSLFDHFRKGAAVSKCAASKARADKLQPFGEKVAVGEERYTVVYQANNSAISAVATFGSHAEASAHMAEVIGADASLTEEVHVIPFAEVNQVA